MNMPRGLSLCIPWQDENLHNFTPEQVFNRLESLCPWTDYLCRQKYANNSRYYGMVWQLTPQTAEQDLSFYPKSKAIIAANEPEVNTESNTPHMVAVGGLKILNQKLPYTIAPNCNIVFAAGMEYMDEFAALAKLQNALPYAWGLHFHGLRNGRELAQHYWKWRDGWYKENGGNRPIVITEASPNSLANFDEKISFLRMAKQLVAQDRKLLSFFWFCSRYRAPNIGYQGSFEWAWLLKNDQHLSDIGYVFKDVLQGVGGYLPIVTGG